MTLKLTFSFLDVSGGTTTRTFRVPFLFTYRTLPADVFRSKKFFGACALVLPTTCCHNLPGSLKHVIGPAFFLNLCV